MTDVIAHRGASRLAKENTIEAFRSAVAVGAAGIELDARRCADGALIVHHDAHLVDGRSIIECPRSVLPPWLPTLSQALDACAGAFVNIEIKNDPSEPDFDEQEQVAEGVIHELAGRPDAAGRWLISSFRLASIDRSRALDPRVPTGWLTVAPVSAQQIADLAGAGHTAIHPWEPTVDGRLIADCHAAGLRVNGWTCNDPARAAELDEFGIDGICTDVPDVILASLRRAR